jgi:hypothetical protein
MDGTRQQQVHDSYDDERQESSNALRSILGRQTTTSDFFENIWQNKATVFPYSGPSVATTSSGDGSWNDDRMKEDPIEEMVHQGWHVLTGILQQSEQEQINTSRQDSPADEHQVPLLFQNRELLNNKEEIEELYGTSLFAPYLNGCSVVLNHGDLLSPWIAALCLDLQKSFPHAYANCYLTPPNSQAVPPHADDRDVLVLQLVGSKDWQVYENVPVPYPYPHEQVGKDGLPVPLEVLEGPTSISTTLRPGDVLYMPRGFVHQAKCTQSLSFHVTIALATHDWSLAGIMSTATQQILTRVVDYRKSILPVTNSSTGSSSDPQHLQQLQLQTQVDAAIQMIQQEVTAGNILSSLTTRLEKHNQRAFPLRMGLVHQARFPSPHPKQQTLVVGPDAAHEVTLTTTLRAATPDERASVTIMATRPRGLNVREEIADDIMAIVSRLKADCSLRCRVLDLRSLMTSPNPLVCELCFLSLAKRGVELGALAVVDK